MHFISAIQLGIDMINASSLAFVLQAEEP